MLYKIKGFLFKRIKPVVAMAVEHIFLWYYSKTAKKRRCKKSSGKVLIARTDGLGDFILWLSVVPEIRDLYRGKKIAMMVASDKPTKEIADKIEGIDEVFCIDIHRYIRFFSIFKMRKKSYDVIIQPVYSRLAFTDLLLFAASADKRITIDTNGQLLSKWEWKITNYGYDQIIKTDPNVRHELIRYAELIRGLGRERFQISLPSLKPFGMNPLNLKNYFIAFPSGSWIGKQWETNKFAQVFDWLIENYGLTCLLSGDKGDVDICKSVIDKMKLGINAKIIAGNYSLTEATEIIRQARLVIGNDTGAIHIAAACGVNSIAIVADRELGRFLPYEVEKPSVHGTPPVYVDGDLECKGCLLAGYSVCRFVDNPEDTLKCIRVISVDRVIDKLKQMRI